MGFLLASIIGTSVALLVLLLVVVLPLFFLLSEGMQDRRQWKTELQDALEGALAHDVPASDQGRGPEEARQVASAADAIRVLRSRDFAPDFGAEEAPETYGYIPPDTYVTDEVAYRGSLQIGSRSHIAHAVEVTGSLALQDEVIIDGDVHVPSNLYMAEGSRISGAAHVTGHAFMGAWTHAGQMRHGGRLDRGEGSVVEEMDTWQGAEEPEEPDEISSPFAPREKIAKAKAPTFVPDDILGPPIGYGGPLAKPHEEPDGHRAPPPSGAAIDLRVMGPEKDLADVGQRDEPVDDWPAVPGAMGPTTSGGQSTAPKPASTAEVAEPDWFDAEPEEPAPRSGSLADRMRNARA